MATVNRKENTNPFEFVQLQSPTVDQQVSLNRACRKFTLTLPANNNIPGFFVIAFISTAKLNLAQPFNLNSLSGLFPQGIQAFPLFQEVSGTRSDECPSIEFECPFTDFFFNFFVINLADATLQTNFAMLICSDTGVKNYKTFTLPGIQLG